MNAGGRGLAAPKAGCTELYSPGPVGPGCRPLGPGPGRPALEGANSRPGHTRQSRLGPASSSVVTTAAPCGFDGPWECPAPPCAPGLNQVTTPGSHDLTYYGRTFRIRDVRSWAPLLGSPSPGYTIEDITYNPGSTA